MLDRDRGQWKPPQPMSYPRPIFSPSSDSNSTTKGRDEGGNKKQRWYSIHTLLWVLPLNPHEWEAVEKATGFVIAGNRKINFSTSKVWGFFCQGIAPWQSTSERWFVGFLFYFFFVSLFQHLLERYVENLFVNRAEGEKHLNLDKDIAQWSICLQFSFKSRWSHNEGFVYCIIKHWSMLWQCLHNCRMIT